jgi:hypothetical protein
MIASLSPQHHTAVQHTGLVLLGLGIAVVQAVVPLMLSLHAWRAVDDSMDDEASSEPFPASVPPVPRLYPADECRELAARSCGSTDVSLLRHPATDELLVRVTAPEGGGYLEIPVEHRDALEAYYHPYGSEFGKEHHDEL